MEHLFTACQLFKLGTPISFSKCKHEWTICLIVDRFTFFHKLSTIKNINGFFIIVLTEERIRLLIVSLLIETFRVVNFRIHSMTKNTFNELITLKGFDFQNCLFSITVSYSLNCTQSFYFVLHLTHTYVCHNHLLRCFNNKLRKI